MDIRICPSCRREFHCGANNQTCWCFDISLASSTLKELAQRFKECLCLECLLKFEKSQSRQAQHFSENNPLLTDSNPFAKQQT
ncbi:MAG: hypothetical protein D6687_05330 [Acidobacteria bacterium]|nr:MAG: hypothetical protein D6687_05330 [Acidobacteriota bacterium]